MKDGKHQRIFVTGGTGFAGSYLLRSLVEAGYTDIQALKRKSSNLSLVSEIGDRIKWIDGDILDQPLIDKIIAQRDVVFHTAAMVSFQSSGRKLMYKTNVEGTENIVNSSLHHNIQHFIHLSSGSTLGRVENREFLTEDSIWKDSSLNTHYARTKFFSEQHVWRAQAEGLKTVILNPTIILGSGFWNQTSAKIISSLYRGLPFYAPGASGYVDVRDVAQCMIRVFERGIGNERFIINASNVAHLDITRWACSEFDKQVPKYKLTPFRNGIIWRVAMIYSLISGVKVSLTRETLSATLNEYNFVNTKSKEFLGIEYIDVEKTVRETCQQYKNTIESGLQWAQLPLNY